MAQTVATPDNLNNFAKELGERIAQESVLISPQSAAILYMN